MRKTTIILVALSFLPSACALGRVIEVPGVAETIQDAVDSAVDGDTVLVADGTYTGKGNIHIDLSGKRISVVSENGADRTVINCKTYGIGFLFSGSENQETLLEGFSIINGYSDDLGGGIRCTDQASPSIVDCIISDNTSMSGGGGLYCSNSSPIVMGCTFTGNSAPQGGGIYTSELSEPYFGNCTICVNSAAEKGGALYSESSFPQAIHCTVAENYAPSGGGIALNGSSSAIIKNSILWNNCDTEILLESATAEISYSLIQDGWPGEGNIDYDPIFIDSSDFHISSGSPCIDIGADAGLSYDMEADLRPSYGGFDIGSDEYVDIDWLDAFVEDYPSCVERFKSLEFTAGVANTGHRTASFDEARLLINGPGSTSRTLYLGPPFSVEPGSIVSSVVSLDVTGSAPLGDYTVTLVIYLEGTELSVSNFTVKVSEDCS